MPRRASIEIGSTGNSPELHRDDPDRRRSRQGQARGALVRTRLADRPAAARDRCRRPARGARRARADHRCPGCESSGADRQRLRLLAQGRGDAAARRRRRGRQGEARSCDRPRQAVGRRGQPRTPSRRCHLRRRQAEDAAANGLPWRGPSFVNVVVSASHPKAKQGDSCWSARTRRRRPSFRTWRASESFAFARRRRRRRPPSARRAVYAQVCRSPSARRSSSRTSSPAWPRASAWWSRHGWSPTQPASAAPRGSRPVSFSAPTQLRLEPDGSAKSFVTWKGHLSKLTGFNCLPGDGPADDRASTASPPFAKRPRAASSSTSSPSARPPSAVSANRRVANRHRQEHARGHAAGPVEAPSQMPVASSRTFPLSHAEAHYVAMRHKLGYNSCPCCAPISLCWSSSASA